MEDGGWLTRRDVARLKKQRRKLKKRMSEVNLKLHDIQRIYCGHARVKANECADCGASLEDIQRWATCDAIIQHGGTGVLLNECQDGYVVAWVDMWGTQRSMVRGDLASVLASIRDLMPTNQQEILVDSGGPNDSLDLEYLHDECMTGARP